LSPEASPWAHRPTLGGDWPGNYPLRPRSAKSHRDTILPVLDLPTPPWRTRFAPAADPLLTNFVEKLTQVNRGRAYFARPYNLGELILADYIKNRRKRVR